MTTYEMKRIAEMQAEYLVEALKKDDELLDLMFPPKFLSAEEAADFCRIPLNTLYQKINEIPHSKKGKRLLFTDRELTKWILRKQSVAVEVEINENKKVI